MALVPSGRGFSLFFAVAVVSTAWAAHPMAFDLQGHRGARGHVPENTLASFAKALDIGVTTLETDMAVTSDGAIVLSHDPRLNPDITRGPDGNWLAAKGPAIFRMSFAELQRYDVGRIDQASRYAKQFPGQIPVDGARIPTLKQLFELGEAGGRKTRYNIETKISPLAPHETPDPDTFARLAVDAIQAAKLSDRVTIQSFDWRTLLAVKRIAPEIATVCLTMEGAEGSNVRGAEGQPSPWLAGVDAGRLNAPASELASAAGCSTWSPYWRNVDAAVLSLAHRLGLKVVPWTVNDPQDIATLIDLGVDGLITDYPDRARAVMQEKGMPLP